MKIGWKSMIQKKRKKRIKLMQIKQKVVMQHKLVKQTLIVLLRIKQNKANQR